MDLEIKRLILTCYIHAVLLTVQFEHSYVEQCYENLSQSFLTTKRIVCIYMVNLDILAKLKYYLSELVGNL